LLVGSETTIRKMMIKLTIVLLVVVVVININNIPGNHDMKELQKTAILGTAHILRKVLA